MFFQIYKSTLKNLVRARTFKLIIIFLGIFLLFSSFDVHLTFKNISDTHKDFVLGYSNYITFIYNAVRADIMLYVMPIFTVVSVAIILNSDFEDAFYEIEKAAGVRPIQYMIGRLLAIITVNFTVVTVGAFILVNTYVFSRGGVNGMDLSTYIVDSGLRIIRLVVFIAWPCILFYIGITYLVGAIFKNGIIAAISSSIHCLFYFSFQLLFRHRIAESYFDYFCPLPRKSGSYLYYFDTPEFEQFILSRDVTFVDFLICVSFLVTVFIVGISLSYVFTHKREI